MTAPVASPATRRVYVHIGLPKTGTTFLQTTMWHNRPQLRAQGLLYPGRERLDHYQAFQQVRGGAQRRGEGRPGAWDRLTRQLGRWDRVGLVSHEFFCMATPAQAARVVADLAPAEVHVVLTVRSYALQFPAIWQEALKMGYDGAFDQFMDEALAGERKGAWGWASQDLPTIVRTWSEVVPPERIHVITVPPPGARRGLLWERWCQTLGIDDSSFELDVSYPNESLGAPQAALLRQVKSHLSGPLLDGPTRHRWVRRYFGHEVLVPQGGPRFAARPSYSSELAERSRQAITAVESGGYDVVGDLTDLLAESPVQDAPHPDDVPAEEMLEVAARAIEQMIRDVRELTLERNEWRRKAQGAARGGVRSVARRVREAVRR